MFECNDNNLLLILGIGIIFLILLKLMYSDNIKKQYRNINYDYNDKCKHNYENFKTNEPVQYIKSYNDYNESIPQLQIQEPQTQQTQQTQQVPQTQTQQVPQTQQSITINVPIINDEIFNPKKFDFDYGDATSTNYTLNDNTIEQKNSQQKLTSNDLLPGKSNANWFENPDVGIKIEDANLLADAIQKVGVDTVGQTRKNPSYDIRGTVPCPKFQISPWNNSTTEPDYNLKSLY